MRRCCIVAALMGLTAVALCAQLRDREAAYRAAVDAYRRGDLEAAASQIAGWSESDLKNASTRIASATAEWRLAEAAAMLHTDLVLQERIVEDEAIAMHLAIADAIVRRMAPTETALARKDVAPFQERWFELGASIFLAMTSPESAEATIGHGLQLFKNSAPLHTLAGVVEEMRGHILDGDLHDPGVVAVMAVTPARRRLVLAMGHYRRAVEIDPRYAPARLRLGRVLALRNEVKAARLELERAMEDAKDSSVRYLALMFLGALSEFEHDIPSARRSYEAAIALIPNAQSATVALSFVDAAFGRESDARALVARVMRQNDPRAIDPWAAYQNGSIDAAARDWLRAEIAR